MDDEQHLLGLSSHGSPSNNGESYARVEESGVTLNSRICEPLSQDATVACSQYIKQLVPALMTEDEDLNKLVKFISSQDLRTFKQIATIKDSSMLNLENSMVPAYTTQGIFDHFSYLRERLRDLHEITDNLHRGCMDTRLPGRNASEGRVSEMEDQEKQVHARNSLEDMSQRGLTQLEQRSAGRHPQGTLQKAKQHRSSTAQTQALLSNGGVHHQLAGEHLQMRPFEGLMGQSGTEGNGSGENLVGEMDIGMMVRPKLKRKARETFESDLQKVRRQEGHTLAANPDANRRRRCIVCCQRCSGGHKHHTRHGTPTRYGCRECMLALLNRHQDDASYLLAQQTGGDQLLLPLCNSARFEGDPRTCFEIHHSEDLSYPVLQCSGSLEDGSHCHENPMG